MVDQIPSDLHGFGIKLNTTQPLIIYNTIKMQIMLEFSTEEGWIQVLFILFLALLSSERYIFNQMWNLTPLMEKLYTCAIMSRKIRLYVYTWKP